MQGSQGKPKRLQALPPPPPHGAATGGRGSQAYAAASVPGLTGGGAGPLSSLSPAGSLTFPLRPSRSPRPGGAKGPGTAPKSRLALASNGVGDGPAARARSWFSSSTRCFLVPTGQGRGAAADPAKRRYAHFQKLPVVGGVGPLARHGPRGGGGGRVRKPAVPSLEEEALALGTHDAVFGSRGGEDSALVRRLRAENKELRAMLAAQHGPHSRPKTTKDTGGGNGAGLPQPRGKPAGEQLRDANAEAERSRTASEVERERARAAAQVEAERARAAADLERERARAASVAQAAAAEMEALKRQLAELKRLNGAQPMLAPGSAESTPRAKKEGTKAGSAEGDIPNGPAAHARSSDAGVSAGATGGVGSAGIKAGAAGAAGVEGGGEVKTRGAGTVGLLGAGEGGGGGQETGAQEGARDRPETAEGGLAEESGGDGGAATGKEDSATLRLVAALAREKLSADAAFEALSAGAGDLSLSDLAAALARTKACDSRAEAEALFQAMGGGAGRNISRQGWCRELSGGASAPCGAADEMDLSIDVSLDSPPEDGARQRTLRERRSRTLRVLAVALKLECGGALRRGLFGAEGGEGDAGGGGDPAALVREFGLDIEPRDVEELASHLAAVGGSVDAKRWREAIEGEGEEASRIVRVMTVVASAVVWDIRTVFDAFPSKAQGDATALAPLTVSRDDLIDMNDSWQFCLSQAEVDGWHAFMDASHSGRVTMRSWVRALGPFCAAISAVGGCLLRMLRDKGLESSAKLFADFDADHDGKLTPEELLKSFREGMPGREFPEEHVSIFHKHLTYFTETGDKSVFPSHWSAAFDLIECDAAQAAAPDSEYAEAVRQTRRAMATEQLAVLLLRSSEGQTPGAMEILASAEGGSGLKHLEEPSLEGLHWRLLLEYGEAAPPLLDEYPGDLGDSAPHEELKVALSSLQRRLATRGSQLLVVLLASHKLPIEAAYAAFCGTRESVSLSRFRQILHLLAPDFGAVSPRTECLFLSLTDAGTERSTVSRARWVEVLERAAGHLSNKQFVDLLLKKGDEADAAAADNGSSRQAVGEAAPSVTYGERQRLCDVFFEHPAHGQAGAEKPQAEGKLSLFIDESRLSLALAKMGVFARRSDIAATESDPKAAKAEALIVADKHASKAKRRRLRRGGATSSDKGGADRAREEGTATLWDFEREVERSRVASTFEQIQLPQIFANALCDEMQPQKGICTPLAMEHLQSKHLMSWMLSMGEDRLRELLGRMYELKKGSIIEHLAKSILHFQTMHEAQANMSTNSKYSTWSSTFAGGLRTARFGKLDDFKKGLDALLGMPSFNIVSQMRREHCSMHNSRTVFAPPNNPDIKTCTADEWDYVVNFDTTREYPAGDERRGGSVDFYLAQEHAKKAGLTMAEVIALRLYSGPLYGHYNRVLRGQEEKEFVTTIHAIVSAIIKLASIMKLPSNRKVYRGLSGVELPPEFWQEDEYGAKGGVEFGIMSTTRKAHVAVQYSTYGDVPTIFEIEIGQVDRGAELQWISQFPGEEEVVMPPLSNLEVTGDPYLKRLEGKSSQILIVPLRVNVNIKSKTMEELEATRKGVLLSGILDMKAVSEQEIGELAQSLGTIKAIAAGQETEWFNDQVAHLQVIHEDAAEARSSEGAAAKCKRLDLLETVAAKVAGPVVNASLAKDRMEARHVAARIMSLEQRQWTRSVSQAAASKSPDGEINPGSEMRWQRELETYAKAHALTLEVAHSFVVELKEATKLTHDNGTARGDAEFQCKNVLDLHKEIVGVLSSNMGKIMSSEALSWHRGDDQHLDHLPVHMRREGSVAVFPRANRVRAVMGSNKLEQQAIQFRAMAPAGCLIALGVFPENVFESWQSGKWRLPSNPTPVSTGDVAEDGSSFGSCQLLKVEGGGVVMLVRTKESRARPIHLRHGLGVIIDEFATLLKQNDKDAEGAFEHFDVDKDGKISLDDMQTALQGEDLTVTFGGVSKSEYSKVLMSQLAGEDGLISRDAWVNAIGAAQVEANTSSPTVHSDENDGKEGGEEAWHRCKGVVELDGESNVGLVLDAKRHRISFSLDSKPVGRSALEAGCTFRAAAAVIVGDYGCEVAIESSPSLWIHKAHVDPVTREDVDQTVKECMNKTLELEIAERKVLLGLLGDGGRGSGPNGKSGHDEEKGNAANNEGTVVSPQAAEVGIRQEAGDEVKAKGLGGTFFTELVGKIGEERACSEFMSMLDAWKHAGYSGLDSLREAAHERAVAIEGSLSSLKSVYEAHKDDGTRKRREEEYLQERASVEVQADTVRFAKTHALDRSRRLTCLVVPCRCLVPEQSHDIPLCHHKETEGEVLKEPARMEEAFKEVSRGCILALDCIAEELLDFVFATMHNVDGNWEEAALRLGPALEVLERTDHIVTGLSSSLNTLQESADSLWHLFLDTKAAGLSSGGSSALQTHDPDVCKLHMLGGIAGKQAQAKMRADAAQDTFERLGDDARSALEGAAASASQRQRDLPWVRHTSMNPELWLLSMFNADHADRVLAWLNRHCVESELMRAVSRLHDGFLQQTQCQRRFNALLHAMGAACAVLPLTSDNALLPTERRSASIKIEVESTLRVLKGSDEVLVRAIRERMESAAARIEKRWKSGSAQMEQIQGVGSEEDKNAAESKPDRGMSGEPDEARWDLRRAEARHCQATILSYVQALEMAAGRSSSRSRRRLDALRQRCVARCLELLDDTSWEAASPGQDFAELHLDDALDEWEARMMGMMSLRHNICRLNTSSIVANSATLALSQELPLSEIASGAVAELYLCLPDLKLAAFVASFIARSSPISVSVYVREKDGKASSMEAPIFLVPGGGLSAHVSTNDANARMLDFGSKGLTVCGLRLLLEAARQDEDVLEATIAGVNDFDLTEGGMVDRAATSIAAEHFKPKALVEDIRFENNLLGNSDSAESMCLICNIIHVTAYHLQLLNLSSNNITSAGSKVLASFLGRAGTTSLKHLDMSGNDLQDQGAEHVAKLLTNGRQKIQNLNLSRNAIGWLGALHLAEAISQPLCELAALNLAGNSVGSQGMVALSAALALNETMRSLNVSSNGIGDIGVEALTHVWPLSDRGSMQALTALDLSENDVTFLGASKLFGVDLDKSAPALTSLSLSSNLICDAGIKKIAQLIPSRKMLHTLCLETQKPLDTVSKSNELQLLVKTELWGDDTCISENDAKLLVLSDIRDTRVQKKLSKLMAAFSANAHGEAAGSAKATSEVLRLHVDKHIGQRRQTVQENWGQAVSKRSEAVAILKDEWKRAGKPLSHLNRRDLSMQSRGKISSLAKCFDMMRAREAVHYLSDHNYTTALTTSLEAKRVCIEGFRTELFASLFQPLSSMPDSKSDDKGEASKNVAKEILLQEVKCLAVQNVAEYQRLLLHGKAYEDKVIQAHLANVSASVTYGCVQEVFCKQAAFETSWSTKLGNDRRAEASARLLSGKRIERIEEFVKELEGESMKLLKENVIKKRQEVLKKQEGSTAESSFGQILDQFDDFVQNGCEGCLRLTVENDEQKFLLQDLCTIHELSCYTQPDVANADSSIDADGEPQALEVGSRVRLKHNYFLFTSQPGRLEPGDVWVIEQKSTPFGMKITKGDDLSTHIVGEAMEAAPLRNKMVIEKKRKIDSDTGTSLRTEQDVRDVFSEHPFLKTLWASSPKLNGMWSEFSNGGRIEKTFSRGNSVYWREVGRLVHQVLELGILKKAEPTLQHQAALRKARYEADLEDFTVTPVHQQLETVKEKLVAFYGENKSTVQLAYELCPGLSKAWDKNPTNPSGMLLNALSDSGRGKENTLEKYLEVQRLLHLVVEAMGDSSTATESDAALGLTWNEFNGKDFWRFREIDCPELAAAIQQGKLVFTSEDFEHFAISDLKVSDYIKVGDKTFQASDARRDKLKGIVLQMEDQVAAIFPKKFLFEVGTALDQPVRIAKQRIETVEHYLAGLFQQEKDDGGSGKERFTSPSVLALLEETAQHAQDLATQKVLARGLSFSAHRSGLSETLSLPVALAACATVQGRKVSRVQRWHLNPGEQSRKYSSVQNSDDAASTLDLGSGWAPERDAVGEWIQIDLGEVKPIIGVVTQRGRYSKYHSVSSFAVEHRQAEDEDWVPAAPANFFCRIEEEKMEHVFDLSPIHARYVKIIVKEWRLRIVLRAGVLTKKSETWEGAAVQAWDKKCLVQFKQGTMWCPVDDLEDVGQTEQAASLQKHLSDELAELKRLYLRGGWHGKSEKVVAEAAKNVKEALNSESKEWEDAVKKSKDGEGSGRQAVATVAALGQPSVCRWLEFLVKSGGMGYLTKFWNLDPQNPTGSVCVVESHQWEILKEFVSGVSSKIQTRIQESCKAADRLIRWCLADETEIEMVDAIVWQEKGQGIIFSNHGTVATGVGYGQCALGTPLVQGSVTFVAKCENAQFAVGVALDGFDASQEYHTASNSAAIIILWSFHGGYPYALGEYRNAKAGVNSGKSDIADNDRVRVVYDGESVEFFVNDESESRFRFDSFEGPVRPLAVFNRDQVSVEVRFEPLNLVERRLVLTCAPREGTDDLRHEGSTAREQADDAASACSAASPCERCVREGEDLKARLVDGLVKDVTALVQEGADKVAKAKLMGQAWEMFKQQNVASKMLPSSEADGRLSRALNRLPASLLAEPQCCQRMTAAVALLAAASAALPLDKRLEALPLGSRFLIPPFEVLSSTPTVMRCVELLECGTGFVVGKENKGLVWEEVHEDKVFLSEEGALATCHEAEGNIHAIGTPFESGSVFFELRSFGEPIFLGIALEGHTLDESWNSPYAVTILWENSTWCSMVKGEHNNTEVQQEKRAPVAGSDRIRVEYNGDEAKFFFNNESDPILSVDGLSGAVRPLVMFETTASIGIVQEKATAIERLTPERATEPLALDIVRSMSPWEARVFGSVCISPYKLGGLALQQLAAGLISTVTLATGDLTGQVAAFLAHFVARCCKAQVRVRIKDDNKTAAVQQQVVLIPGGGLDAHVRRDTTQAAASSKSASSHRDRLLFLSGAGVGVEALRLLMEAALAGLREAAPAREKDVAPDTAHDGNAVEGAAAASDAEGDMTFSKKLAKTARSIESLAASKAGADRPPTNEVTEALHAFEMDENPLIGAGGGVSMRLIVQMAQMASGAGLVRLSLASCRIEDEGVRVLARAFTRDAFAPSLKKLWLSDNSITDAGAKDLAEAVESSLTSLAEMFLYRNKFTTNGKAILRQKASSRALSLTSPVSVHL